MKAPPFDPSQPYKVEGKAPPFDPSQPYKVEGKAPPFDPSQPYETPDTLAQQARYVGSALVTGIKRAVQSIDVLDESADALSGLGQRPTYRQQRRAFEAYAADPRALQSRTDPMTGRVDFTPGLSLYGPDAKLEAIRRPQQTAREARQFDIARQQEELQQRPRSQTMRDWDSLSDNDLAGIAKTIARNPVEIISTIALETLPPSLAGLAGGPQGVALASAATDYSSSMVSEAQRQGYDLTDPKQVAAFFSNRSAFDEAHKVALTRAAIIGPVDALSVGLAGTFIRRATGKGAARMAGATGAEVGMQMTAGAGGEALASKAAGQDISLKDVVAEAIGELGGAPFEAARNLRGERAAPAPPPDGDVDAGQITQTYKDQQQTAFEVPDLVLPDPTDLEPRTSGPTPETIDWSTAGAVSEDQAPGESLDNWTARRQQTARTLSHATSLGLQPDEVDVRWAPDLQWNGRTVAGWHDRNTGKVVLNAAAPAMASSETAAPVVREEMAHRALSEPDARRQVLAFAVERMTDAEVQALQAQGYRQSEGETDLAYRERLADEFIAKQAAANTPWWRDLVQRVRAWIAEKMPGWVELTNEEVARSILRAAQRPKEQKGGVQDAQKEGMQETVAQPQVRAALEPPAPARRKFADQVQESADVSDAVRGRLRNTMYQRRANEDDNAFASRIIEQVGGPEPAIEVWRDRASGLPEAVRGFVGQQIIKRLGDLERVAESTNPDEAQRLADRAARFMDEDIFPATTEAGQFIQSFAAFGRLTPRGMLGVYRRTIDGAQRKVRQRLKPALDRIRRALGAVNAEGIQDLVKDAGAQTATTKAVNESIGDRKGVREAIRNQAIRKAFSRGDLLKKIRAALAGRNVNLQEIVAGHYRLTGDGQTLAQRIAAESGLPEAEAADLARQIEDVLRTEIFNIRNNLDARIRRVREDEARRKRTSRMVRLVRSEEVNPELVPDAEIDDAIRVELGNMRSSIGRVLHEHYTAWEPTGQTLAEKLVADAGLTDAAAAKLARQIEERFRGLLRDRRRREILRLAKAMPRKYRAKLPAERLAELANLGLLSEEQVWEAAREKLNLPAYSRESAAEVTRQANALQKLPEGFRRDEAAMDLLNYIAQQKGVSRWDLAMAFWYANILSGPFTHVINNLSNLTQVAMHTSFAAIRDPMAIPGLIDATAEGFRRGLSEAGRVLATGKVTGTRALKMEPATPIELMGNKTWTQKVLNKWKYVARMLGAEDLLLYKTSEAQRQYVLARAVAKEEGLTGRNLQQRVREIMHGTEAQRAEADATVAAEGLKGTAAAKRRAEILSRNLPAGIEQNARDYALRVIFNGEPYGVLGKVASAVKYLLSQVPPMRLVIPFVDVVANLTNEALNYFPPVGAGRAIAGRYVGRLNGKDLDLGTEQGRADLWDQQAKAIFGTVALAGLAAAAAGNLDDEDPAFAIYGAGPGDPGKTRSLRATGWRPWSIKVGNRWISYQDSPLAIGLASVGSYMDALRWRDMSQADALDRVAMVMMSWPRVVVDRSFLKGLSDLFTSISRETTPGKAGSVAANRLAATASSFVIPNFFRQMDKLMDPTVTDTRTVEGALLAQLPFVRRLGRPALTVLGDTVESSPSDRIASPLRDDRLMQVLTQKQAWVSVPEQGDLTDDEFYDLVKVRGQRLRELLTEWLPQLEEMEPELAQRVVSRISSRMSRASRAEILSRRD